MVKRSVRFAWLAWYAAVKFWAWRETINERHGCLEHRWSDLGNAGLSACRIPIVTGDSLLGGDWTRRGFENIDWPASKRFVNSDLSALRGLSCLGKRGLNAEVDLN